MTVSELQRIRPLLPPSDGGRPLGPLPGDRPGGGEAFASSLVEAVQRVDGAQKGADEQVQAFVAGEQENLHEVMISMNEAQLKFQLMTEVRNRTLEGYQELMRMQV